MTEIRPFKGIIYNTSRVRGDEVVAPPYDIITPEMKDALYEKSPYNIVRIDFGKDQANDTPEGENRYTRARRFLQEWLEEGILIEPERPSYYLYQVSYRINDEERIMRGVFARVRLTELCEGVFPHEATHSKPKADRLNLMRYCRANISPIFSIFNNPEESFQGLVDSRSSEEPYLSAIDHEGARHELWIVDDPDDVEFITGVVEGRPIYIADGHHRYETALEYMKERKRDNPGHTGEEPYNFTLMLLVNIPDGGLSILPTHRLVRGIPSGERDLLDKLSGYFDIEKMNSHEQLLRALPSHEHAIGMILKNSSQSYILIHKGIDLHEVPRPLRGLDVTVLHELIFKNLLSVEGVSYEMDPRIVINRVRSGEYSAGFFLNPTRVSEVEEVALECLRMPPKSTYFYPKILTGFVINRLD